MYGYYTDFNPKRYSSIEDVLINEANLASIRGVTSELPGSVFSSKYASEHCTALKNPSKIISSM